jgi:hypothetical protein
MYCGFQFFLKEDTSKLCKQLYCSCWGYYFLLQQMCTILYGLFCLAPEHICRLQRPLFILRNAFAYKGVVQHLLVNCNPILGGNHFILIKKCQCKEGSISFAVSFYIKYPLHVICFILVC